MGKLNMSLLKGVEEQESVIDKNKSKEKSQTAQESIKISEKPKTLENIKEEIKGGNQEETKSRKQSFSFRAEQHRIERWKLYAEAIGTDDLGALWSAAIDEYIEKHELTDDQKTIYDLKKQAYEVQKRINSR